MDNSGYKRLIDASVRRFCDALERCRDGSVCDPELVAPAVSKVEALFQRLVAEIAEALGDTEQPEK